MAKVDVTDEAILESPPKIVYGTFLNELSGITQWWMPHLQCKSREGKLICHDGEIFDATIHPENRLKVKVSCKITKMVEPRSIAIEYSGDFIGTGEYTFEPNDKGTKVKFRFNVKTHNPLATLLAPFVNIAKAHSEVMQQGFKACNNYLKQT
jgi:uncharacterized protein YndB with AHSA1/START domain